MQRERPPHDPRTQALGLLAEVGAILAGSLDVTATVVDFAKSVLPQLGEVCAVYRRASDGTIERLAAARIDGATVRVLAAPERVAPGVERLVPRALASRRAEIVPEVPDALRAASCPGAVMIVPFAAGSGTAGVLIFAAPPAVGRAYDALDLELACQLGDRLAVALENARLYQDTREAARRAEASFALLDALFGSVPVGLAFLDRDLRYVRINAALAAVNQVPVEETLGRTVCQVIPSLAGTVEPLLRRVLATGEPVLDVDMAGTTCTGRRWGHWLVSYYPVRAPGGDLFGVGVVVTDITERKRAEDEREGSLDRERAARTEAERASRVKDDFVATVSHELRTPLNAIQGYTQLARRPGATPEQVGKALAVIERNAGLLTQLVSDLLDVSRIGAGKLRVSLAPVRLSGVVAPVVEGQRAAAEAKGVSLRLAPTHADDLVLGDAGRLAQVTANLVANALKFTPRGGAVDVSLCRAHGRVVLQVTDTGQGIAPEFLPHVFDRFRQADASTARRHGGLGLGLSIVKNVVEQHGGHVRVESEGLGKGARFVVELPRAPRRACPSAAEGPASADLGGVRVLVVEDEPDARELWSRILEEHRADVGAVGSGAEALAALGSGAWDVLVSDIGMPGMDGYELIRQIRAGRVPAARDVPALAVTAFARPEDRKQALGAGFQEHVAKPLDPALLVSAVAGLAKHG